MITVTNLTKQYGTNLAVNDLSFSIDKGKIYGLLGPNGAGKSTTMGMITGCLSATSGQVLINGIDILKHPVQTKRKLGYLPEMPPLYTELTPWEYLRFVAEAKGLRGKEITIRAEQSMSLTDILPMKNRLIKNLSKGYRQRVGLSQAILGDPEVIVLDEPLAGLDPRQIIEMRELICNLGKTHTVIFSSHILSEVREICDHIIIISAGKLVASDTPSKLGEIFSSGNVMRMTVRGRPEIVRTALASLSGITRLEVEAQTGSDLLQVVLESDTGTDLREAAFFSLSDIRSPILSMNQITADLEDIFLKLTEQNEEVS